MATFTATNSLDLVGSQVITGGLTIGNIAQGAEVVDGLKVTTGGVTIDSGGLTVTAGGATVTAGGLTVNSGAATVPYLSVTGLSSDVNSGARFVGATSGAAPQGGTYAIGDYVIGRNGTLWICTIAGSPGTWQQVSGGGSVTYGTPIAVTYGATAFQGNAASAARSDHVHSTADIPSLSQNNTFSGNITVSGNLTINSTATTIVDPIIDIGGAANGAAPSSDDAKDRGIAFQWHNGTDAKRGFFGWDRSVQRFSFIPDATITSEVVSGTLGNIDVTKVFASTGLVIDSLNGISSLGSAGDHKAYLGFMSPGNNNWTTTDLVYTYENGSTRTVPYLSRTSTWTATQTFSNATSAIFGSGDGTGTITGGLLRAPSGTGTNIAGGSLTIAGGASTGTGAGGNIIFQTADAGITSGSSVNSLTERIRINEYGTLISQRFGDVLAANTSFTGGAWKYINSNPAWLMGGYSGDSTAFRLYTFPSGTAGASISTWNLSIAIPALTGYVGINTSTPSQWLEVYGKIASRPASTQDAIIISGRAGGTSSYAITLTPTTLTTNQTIYFPNSSGTVALQSDTTYIGTTAVTLNRASANLALTGITSVNGITVSGSSGTFALQGDTQYIGTTAVTLNRASANLALTGISSVTLPGSTSGTIQIVPSAVAGTNTQFTLPATSGTAITSGDTGTVTNTMLAGSIANAKLTNSSVTVNGTAIALGASGTVTATATNALTIGSGLSGSSYNGSSPVTISLNTANANTWTATQTFADINVTGTLSVVQTLITAIENPTIDLGGLTGGGAPTSDDNKDRGFTFQWHNGTSAKKGFLGYTDSTGVLSFIPDSTETSGVYSGTYGVAKFGGIQLNLSSVSANTTLDNTYSYVLATGTITVTLPTAVGITGRLYWIKKMDTGTTLTIATTSSQTIDGSSTLTVNTQYASYTLVSNGSNWIIV
jgi:hypothetical protein